jgi:hypothetical protein
MQIYGAVQNQGELERYRLATLVDNCATQVLYLHCSKEFTQKTKISDDI